MCHNESWRAIVAPKKAHSTLRGQPPRMHGSGSWRYEQKEQRVTPVPLSGVNCDLWCPGWNNIHTYIHTYILTYIHTEKKSRLSASAFKDANDGVTLGREVPPLRSLLIILSSRSRSLEPA